VKLDRSKLDLKSFTSLIKVIANARRCSSKASPVVRAERILSDRKWTETLLLPGDEG